MIHFHLAANAKCYRTLKERLLVEPLNHSTFARRHSFEMQIFLKRIQKAGDFSLAQKSAWFNLVNAHPVFLSYIYMCICRMYAHIYSRYTCTVCIVTYIWFYGSSCCQEATKKKQKNIRAAGLRRSNSN